MTRRKTYIVTTKYVSIKKYELLAENVEHAKELINNGYCAGLTDIVETFNIEKVYRKERASK